MADSNPPYKVYDREAPSDGNGNAPNSSALQEQVTDGEQQHHRQHESDAKAHEPPIRGGTGQHNGADFFRHRAEGVARLNDRSPLRVDRHLILLVHYCSSMNSVRG